MAAGRRPAAALRLGEARPNPGGWELGGGRRGCGELVMRKTTEIATKAWSGVFLWLTGRKTVRTRDLVRLSFEETHFIHISLSLSYFDVSFQKF
jgi:hypothetical protein